MTDHKVTDIRDRWTSEQAQSADARRDKARRDGDNGGNGGEPPMNDLTARVEHLERDVTDIKVTLAGISTKLDGFATKTELAQMEARIIKWNVGTLLAVGGLVFAIMRFLPA